MTAVTKIQNDDNPIETENQFRLLETTRTTRWAIVDIVVYVVMQLAYGFAAFGLAMALGLVPPGLNAVELDVRSFMTATLIGLVVASTHMLYLRRASLKAAWHYKPAKHLWYPKLVSAALLLVALLLGALYTNLINQPLQPEYKILGDMVYDGGWQAVVVLLAVVVFGPAVEELLFRVQLQAAVAKKMAPRIGEQKAIALGMVASTIVFAFIHFQITASPAQLLLGGALALIYQRHRSFAEVWLLHSAVNLLGILTINS